MSSYSSGLRVSIFEFEHPFLMRSFNSCGMDASEHETPSMSRHNRRVPTSFFYRFARDACALSERYAGGRLISVLEGGYSDRALTSGAMAHLCGLTDSSTAVDEEWWNVDNLVLVSFLPAFSSSNSDTWTFSSRKPPRNGEAAGRPSPRPIPIRGSSRRSRSSRPSMAVPRNPRKRLAGLQSSPRAR
jgi:histone deacetylase HOS3